MLHAFLLYQKTLFKTKNHPQEGFLPVWQEVCPVEERSSLLDCPGDSLAVLRGFANLGFLSENLCRNSSTGLTSHLGLLISDYRLNF